MSLDLHMYEKQVDRDIKPQNSKSYDPTLETHDANTHRKQWNVNVHSDKRLPLQSISRNTQALRLADHSRVSAEQCHMAD